MVAEDVVPVEQHVCVQSTLEVSKPTPFCAAVVFQVQELESIGRSPPPYLRFHHVAASFHDHVVFGMRFLVEEHSCDVEPAGR